MMISSPLHFRGWATVKMFQDRDWKVTYAETDGGHTWLKWRDYLVEYSQLLFR